MSSSCSSEYNVCSACAPNLSLFAISASTSQGKVGYTCLDASSNDTYFNKSITYQGTRTSTLTFCAEDGTDTETRRNNGNSSERSIIKNFIDKFGNILFYTITNYNNNASVNTNWLCGTYGANLNESTYQIANLTECPLDSNIETITSCKYRAYNNDSCAEESEDVTYDECCPFPEAPQLCVSAGPSCLELDPIITTTTSCTTETTSVNASYNIPVNCDPCCSTGDNKQCNAITTTTLSENKDLSFFYGLCKSSVSTKIGLLEANQPQNCNGTTCGEGKDACWGGAGAFSIADNNLDDPSANSTTSQKLKFKIAAPKEGFDEKYKSISGRVIFYYGGTEGKTPCCDDDFDGTIVEEKSYSISSGPTFKDDYFAVDCGDFDNDNQSLVGETINICYTVDNISFI